MENNLYKYFGCRSKEALYRKVKKNDESVNSLLSFLDFAKKDMKMNSFSLTSPEVVAEYIRDFQLPSKNDEAMVIFTNVKNHPVHIARVHVEDKQSIYQCLKEGLNAGASNSFNVFPKKDGLAMNSFMVDFFKPLNIKVFDSFIHDDEDRMLHSLASDDYFDLDELNRGLTIAEDKALFNDGNANKTKGYQKMQGYDDFASHFAKEEIEGLNVFENNKKIKELLKVGFQDKGREIFGLMMQDKNGKVIRMKELFAGGTSSAVIDVKIIAKEILNEDNVTSITVFHNHPSGVSLTIV